MSKENKPKFSISSSGMGYNMSAMLLIQWNLRKEAALVTTANGAIRCSRVEISETGISELDGEKVLATFRRDQIRRIQLCYATNAKYPFFQYFLGFTLLSFALIGLLVTFLGSAGGRLIIRPESVGFPLPIVPTLQWLMAGIGFWLLVGIFSGRYLFLIDTGNQTHKIFFEKSVDIDEIRQIIRKAQLKFGYAIDDSILQKKMLSS